MATNTRDLQHFRPLLVELNGLRQGALSKSDRAAISELIAAMTAFQIETEQATATAPEPAPVQTIDSRSPYYGRSLGDAGIECIRMGGKGMKPEVIWEQLRAAGFQSAHADPVHALEHALYKKARTGGVVLRLPDGTWALSAWHADDLPAIKKAVRSEKTKAGMRLAKERGTRVGQPRKVDDSNREDIERRILAGEKMQDIAARYDMSEGCLRTYYPKEKLEEIRSRASADGDGRFKPYLVAGGE